MRNMANFTRALLAFSFLVSTQVSQAAGPPCNPCAGISVDDPHNVTEPLASTPRLEGEARLYVAWPAELDGLATNAGFETVRAAGGTPWMVLRLRTPAPVQEHLAELDRELKEVARLATDAGERAHFQIHWLPAAEASAVDHAFVVKRAAVAITGAQAAARVLVGPLAAEPGRLRELYAEEVAAYVDGVALMPAPRGDLEAALAVLAELDPGKPVVLDNLAWPEDPRLTLARAAEYTELGLSVTLFELGDDASAEDLMPLKLLAREFQGDLSFDPYSVPSGAAGSWAFVRGEDLSLRVIAEVEPDTDQLFLMFGDPQLRSPAIVDLETGNDAPAFGQRRTESGLLVPIEEPGRAVMLKLERMSIAELEGVEETVEVEDRRQLPVEEILRRLQAVEDAQARRLSHYQATHTMHLRFALGTGVQNVEASYEGSFFFRQGEGFDWVWEKFYFNGVRWRSKKLPEIPLIEPEKAAALPLEILLTKEYSYRLRGTGMAQDRDCWVVDFEPLEAAEGRSLYQGTVWIDRGIFARVKTRTLQLGLEGEVISNEETVYFTPVDALGRPAEWATSSYFLPTRIVGQQVLSVLNAPVQLEKENVLTEIRINSEDFATELAAAHDSELTMVRDTAEGMRYLVKNDEGERVVDEDSNSNQFFLVAGGFYDPSLDTPVPLAGFNYLSLDFRGTGRQVNVFFGGALLVANYATPRFFGSRWDAGMNAFGFFIPLGQEQFRDGVENPAEEIERRPADLSFFLGRPLGDFVKLDLTYELDFDAYQRADDTAADFVLPQDTLTHTFETQLTFQRAGYRVRLEGSYNKRSDWEFWGLPGNTEFNAEQEDYILWKFAAGKTWWLPRFMKFGLELEHLDGTDLDRFSKYDFGFFDDSRVRGYQSGLVRAEEADLVHLTYGFDLGEVFRIQLLGDVAWASDEISALDREVLAGVGLNGTLLGPWRTIINFDIGVPVTGPADDFVAFVSFLKLFDRDFKLFGKKKKKKE